MTLEQDLHNSELILQLVTNDTMAQNLYCALCNTMWKNKETGEKWSASWRSVGGIVADLRSRTMEVREDYLDWYCSGIGIADKQGHVKEGVVTDIIRDALDDLGWEETEYDHD